MKTQLLFISLFLIASCQYQRSSEKKNIIDQNGYKQGAWVYYYDNEWNVVQTVEGASFYRLINYINDSPTGLVVDYFADGRLQMTADSLISEDPETYHGALKFYTESGRVHQLEYYSNGIMDTIETLRKFEELFVQYQKEIPNDLDLAQTANDLAYLYREQKRYEKAAKLYELALNIRQDELGVDNLLYANSCAKLGWVCIKLDNMEYAEKLFAASLIVYQEQLGEQSDRYKTSKEHLDWINEKVGSATEIN